jgi:hypothetical protein
MLAIRCSNPSWGAYSHVGWAMECDPPRVIYGETLEYTMTIHVANRTTWATEAEAEPALTWLRGNNPKAFVFTLEEIGP